MQAEAKQMRLVDPILMELEQEAEITKRLLDIVPEDKLSWRPHPKARSLGELAMHLATLQGSVAEIGPVGHEGDWDVPNRLATFQPRSDIGILRGKPEEGERYRRVNG